MIIDTHVHLVGLREEHGCFVHPKMMRGPVFRFLRAMLGLADVERDELDEAYADRLVELVEDSDLDAAGVLALDGVYDDAGRLDRERTRVLVGNDYCLEVCARSDRLLPICSVNPMRRDAIEELERVAGRGAVAIKTLPNSQGFDPGDERFEPFWRRMAALDLPLLTHTSFEHTIPPIDQSFGKPERLRRALDLGVVVIAAHCASAGVAHPFREDFDTWVEMLSTYPNLYGDISAMASPARFPYIHRVLRERRAHGRVLLGSDFPIPVMPSLFVAKLGFRETRRLSRIDNPLQRNLEVFDALGVDGAAMRRAAKILRLDDQRLPPDVDTRDADTRDSRAGEEST
jgi:predicted TIM-barrel fold metal-dependent hydrolase